LSKKRAGFVPSRAQVAWAALGLALLGWLGLVLFTYISPADEASLPILLAILFCAVSASAVPWLLGIHARLDRTGRLPLGPPLRQALEVGGWAALCVWLQWVRLLNWITAALCLVIIALIEWFILSRPSRK
jgi:hypothetical protein